MKKIVFSFVVFLMLMSCKEIVVEVPEKLIKEEKMIDIFYDLSLLEAMLNYNPSLMSRNNINPHTYVYEKYGIDSLQFVTNNKYYASNIKKYDKMYEKVQLRMEQTKADYDTLMKKQASEPKKEIVKDSLKPRKRPTMIKD
jgi:hypothetical protein